jgi:hypothetical protein
MIGFYLLQGCQHPRKEISPAADLRQLAAACWQNQDFACAEKLLGPVRQGPVPPADPHLIHLSALVAADARNPAQDLAAAARGFHQLVERPVDGQLTAEAMVWLGLLEELRAREEALARADAHKQRLTVKISDQQKRLDQMKKLLERLKAVDLTLE